MHLITASKQENRRTGNQVLPELYPSVAILSLNFDSSYKAEGDDGSDSDIDATIVVDVGINWMTETR